MSNYTSHRILSNIMTNHAFLAGAFFWVHLITHDSTSYLLHFFVLLGESFFLHICKLGSHRVEPCQIALGHVRSGNRACWFEQARSNLVRFLLCLGSVCFGCSAVSSVQYQLCRVSCCSLASCVGRVVSTVSTPLSQIGHIMSCVTCLST